MEARSRISSTVSRIRRPYHGDIGVDYAKQARRALSVYVDRGHRALDALMLEDLDALENWLRLRKAAFHNFRHAEELSRRMGVVVTEESEVKALWSESAILDTRLEAELATLRNEYEQEMQRLSQAKRTFGKIKQYKAGTNEETRFERSV